MRYKIVQYVRIKHDDMSQDEKSDHLSIQQTRQKSSNKTIEIK